MTDQNTTAGIELDKDHMYLEILPKFGQYINGIIVTKEEGDRVLAEYEDKRGKLMDRINDPENRTMRVNGVHESTIIDIEGVFTIGILTVATMEEIADRRARKDGRYIAIRDASQAKHSKKTKKKGK